MSADVFVAGPHQAHDHPLGIGGERRLHAIEMGGGTTFHFVTDGIESAHTQAEAAAGDQAISIAGGASCVRQAIRAGLVDEIDIRLNPVAHLRFRVIRP